MTALLWRKLFTACPDTVFWLEIRGTLGAGKTTWARALLRALGVKGTIKSPSYTVLELYDTPFSTVAHFDFYRFNDPQEWEDAGFRDEANRPGLKLAEWPEKAAGMIPPADAALEWQPPHEGDDECQRLVRWMAYSPAGVKLCKDW